jgi:hypothetical protein
MRGSLLVAREESLTQTIVPESEKRERTSYPGTGDPWLVGQRPPTLTRWIVKSLHPNIQA